MYMVCLLQAVLTFTSSKLGIVGDIDAPVSILLLLPMHPSLAFDITLILSVPTVTFSTIHAHTTAFETVVVVFASPFGVGSVSGGPAASTKKYFFARVEFG